MSVQSCPRLACVYIIILSYIRQMGLYSTTKYHRTVLGVPDRIYQRHDAAKLFALAVKLKLSCVVALTIGKRRLSF